MTKQDFLHTLEKILRRELTEREVNENIRYYDQYISQEMAAGKPEHQVLLELGDPRLIARTILQVDAQKDGSVFGKEKVFTEDGEGGYQDLGETDSDKHGKWKVRTVSSTKGWIILALVLAVLFVIIRTAFVLFIKLLPVILVIAGVVWVKKKFFT